MRIRNTGPVANRGIYERIRRLTLGDELLVRHSEWKSKTLLNYVIPYNRNYAGRFLIDRLDDKSGWMIMRIK
jgi:hypothetical protein